MMLTRFPHHLGFCALTAAMSTAPCSQGASLQHDLFARPPLEQLKQEQPQTVKTVAAAPVPEWKPELKAIITGGGTALVNVEGRIVQMGGEIDGYRLVEVRERRAIFVRDKVRYTLVLNAVKAADGQSGTATGTATATGIGSVKTSDVLPQTAPVKPEASSLPPPAAKPPERGGA
jgi:hypothetical protein